MERGLAIDIGSNAVRAVIGEISDDGKLIVLEQFRESVRLGREVFSEGKISEETIEKLLVALKGFQASGKAYKVSKMRAVATSAMREATNQDEVLEKARAILDCPIEIIPGDEEARLVSEGVQAFVDIKGKRAALLDIGGGSTEVSILDDGAIILSESVKVGSLRLLEIAEKSGNLLKRMISQYSRSLIGRLLERVKSGEKAEVFIGTGGNCDALLSLQETFLKIKSPNLQLSSLKEISKELGALSIEDRIKRLGLRPDRADVIYPASLFIIIVLETLGFDELVVPKVGLKEGVLLELLSTEPKKVSQRQLTLFAEELLKRFRCDVKHARAVASICLKIYDALPETKLTDEERTLLRLSALLHDIGDSISPEGHHKHSYYIIQQTPFVGINFKQREIVALAARYHRKSHPSLKHDGFKKLSESDREVVRKLAGILRIAEALEQEHRNTSLNIEAACSQNQLILTITGDEVDVDLEKWKAKKRSDLFEEVFKRELIIQ